MSLLHDRTRGRGPSALRAMAFAYMYDHLFECRISYAELGRMFGGRDKATIYELVRRGHSLLSNAQEWDINVVLDLVTAALFPMVALGSHGEYRWEPLAVPPSRWAEPTYGPIDREKPHEATPRSPWVPNPYEEQLERIVRFISDVMHVVPNETKPALSITVTIQLSGTEKRD